MSRINLLEITYLPRIFSSRLLVLSVGSGNATTIIALSRGHGI